MAFDEDSHGLVVFDIAEDRLDDGLSAPISILKGDKARFYRMAKRSATECAAVLDVCRELQLVEVASLNEGRDLLIKIVSMLIKLIRSFEAP